MRFILEKILSSRLVFHKFIYSDSKKSKYNIVVFDFFGLNLKNRYDFSE